MSAALAYDAIVVGSGAGGAAVAYRLVRSGLRVLQLEKGTYLPVDGSTLDVERVVHQREFLAREPWVDGRGATLGPEEHFNVGGKTKWDGAALLRFSPAPKCTASAPRRVRRSASPASDWPMAVSSGQSESCWRQEPCTPRGCSHGTWKRAGWRAACRWPVRWGAISSCTCSPRWSRSAPDARPT